MEVQTSVDVVAKGPRQPETQGTPSDGTVLKESEAQPVLSLAENGMGPGSHVEDRRAGKEADTAVLSGEGLQADHFGNSAQTLRPTTTPGD